MVSPHPPFCCLISSHTLYTRVMLYHPLLYQCLVLRSTLINVQIFLQKGIYRRPTNQMTHTRLSAVAVRVCSISSCPSLWSEIESGHPRSERGLRHS